MTSESDRWKRESGNPELFSRLEAAEAKLQDLKSNMAVLGKEAASVMAAVAAQQQNMTLQRLISMAELERTYHQKVIQSLDHLEGEVFCTKSKPKCNACPLRGECIHFASAFARSQNRNGWLRCWRHQNRNKFKKKCLI